MEYNQYNQQELDIADLENYAGEPLPYKLAENIKPMEGSKYKSILPSGSEERKAIPIYSGCINYFPLALIEVARLSKKGNDQHNPGHPLHWDRSKSGDELDALMRHLIEGDWVAVAWRALAHCQKELEKNR